MAMTRVEITSASAAVGSHLPAPTLRSQSRTGITQSIGGLNVQASAANDTPICSITIPTGKRFVVTYVYFGVQPENAASAASLNIVLAYGASIVPAAGLIAASTVHGAWNTTGCLELTSTIQQAIIGKPVFVKVHKEFGVAAVANATGANRFIFLCIDHTGAGTVAPSGAERLSGFLSGYFTDL